MKGIEEQLENGRIPTTDALDERILGAGRTALSHGEEIRRDFGWRRGLGIGIAAAAGIAATITILYVLTGKDGESTGDAVANQPGTHIAVGTQPAETTPPGRLVLRFRVIGSLDDPLLGKIEEAVAARLRELDLQEVRVERLGESVIAVHFLSTSPEASGAVKKALARPDRFLLAMAATRDEIRAAFGSDFGEDTLRRRVQAVKRSSLKAGGIRLYRNRDDPTHPSAPDDQPLFYYHPSIPMGKGDDIESGVIVVARSDLRCTGNEIKDIELWGAKLTGGLYFVLNPDAQTRLQSLVTRQGDLCVILNGRCAGRFPKPGGPMAAATSYGRARIGLSTSVLGGALSRRGSVLCEWVRQKGQCRRLVPASDSAPESTDAADKQSVSHCKSNLKSLGCLMELYHHRFKGYPSTRSGVQFLLAPLKAQILDHKPGTIEKTVLNTYVCPGDDRAKAAIAGDFWGAFRDVDNIDPACVSYAGRNTIDFPLDRRNAHTEAIACCACGPKGRELVHGRIILVLFLDSHIEEIDIDKLPGLDGRHFEVGPKSPIALLRTLNKNR